MRAYDYNLRNELVRVTDPAGNMWSYAYDLPSRERTVSDPDAGATTYSHDDAAN
ncbi:RHS repeat protein [Micromonospora sp. KC723]|uniref:RHS repeat protein n=1 Tax=Micromonospora sp. KC723 TaxID=2530381 RepID=UPI00104AEABC|nr:RHS repeat protein [Micromonospora sp. KC723]TDB78315.1 hypothetical protein E1165_01235 [Micromonospora sp. KC723]